MKADDSLSEPTLSLSAVASTLHANLPGGDPGVDLQSRSATSTSARIHKLKRSADSEDRYVLAGEIGRGGMGAILKVFDTDLRRDLPARRSRFPTRPSGA